ncbi:MAG TPA: bifunctional adenosylcobinamide kinase/adenosylcobinamide-phosphate guanylyltransferase [Bryobacteraceae bacterium]|nr:bifunctional adenosylcobinamide kinase/adenosylcobinamide-phosphate guanylyltransferase [Bryobacteraceae bacterium]
MLTFIIGGARSGKTALAQSLCRPESRVAYLATMRAEDDELRARIQRHRSHRPATWTTIEEPLAVASAVRRASREFDSIVLDCLTLWLSNLCWEHRACDAEELERRALAEADDLVQSRAHAHLIVVSNEVGSGIVPENAVARQFRDLQGFVNQHVARAADEVWQTVAGIPVRIKG